MGHRTRAVNAGPLDSGFGRTQDARMSTKELAHAAIEALPDDATLQDAAERLELLAAVEQGRKSVRQGRSQPQTEVEKFLPTWLGN